MSIKSLSLKLAGGLLAIGVMAIVLGGQVAPASADRDPGRVGPPNAALDGCKLGILKPNIKATGISISPNHQNALVSYVNEGPCSTGLGFYITVVYNGGPEKLTFYQEAMAPGESGEKVAGVPLSMRNAPDGASYITFYLDYHIGHAPLTQINESNEIDNVVGVSF